MRFDPGTWDLLAVGRLSTRSNSTEQELFPKSSFSPSRFITFDKGSILNIMYMLKTSNFMVWFKILSLFVRLNKVD